MRSLSLEIQQPLLCRSSDGGLTVSRSLRRLAYGSTHHVHKPPESWSQLFHATEKCQQDASININIFTALLEQME